MIDYTVNPAAIGERIRRLRLKQNKTQSYWADMLFISPSYLSLIEDGKRIPKLEVLIQLARVGQVSLDYLVFGMRDLWILCSLRLTPCGIITRRKKYARRCRLRSFS